VDAPATATGRGRIVFSSSGTPTRATGTTAITREGSLFSALASGVNGVATALFATLFPADCRLCGSPLRNISRLPVCNECLSAMRPVAGALCSVCGERLDGPYRLSSETGDALCGLCRRLEPPFVKAAAYGSYEGGLRELIHLLKYDQVRPAANVLGRMLAEAISDLQPLFSDQPVLVVPVPLYSRRFRQRGFNQAELIARAALKLLSGTSLQLRSDLMQRTRETRSQIGLSRHQRRENMRSAFAVAQRLAVEAHEVLLVDDVFTTGTTVSECARVLRRAGASKVYVATVARTLKAEAEFATPPGEAVEEVALAAHG
jgi:ComF family protein